MDETSLNEKELQEYLHQVAKMETSVYNQQKIIANTENKFKSEIPVSNFKEKEQNTLPKIPDKPKEPETIGFWGCIIVAFFFGGLGIWLTIALLLKEVKEDGILPILLLTIVSLGAAIYSIYLIVNSIKNNKKNKNKYTNELERYSKQLQWVNKEQAKCIKENKLIDERNKQAREAYNTQFNLRLQAFNDNRSTVIDTMTSYLTASKELLAELYDKNIIFEKYRNMVAMTTIYEYFASGRVSSLTGPNGAYNLYESELRQNVIIKELKTIGNNLEQIKSNQFVLYTELEKGNRELNQVSYALDSIVSSAVKIQDFSQLTAYYSDITATNTTVQTYLK